MSEDKTVQNSKDEYVSYYRKIYHVIVQEKWLEKTNCNMANTKIPILYSPTVILIKILECFVELFISFKPVPMHCS